MKLLIRNLARHTTEAAVRSMFESYGKVQSCTLVMDKDTGDSKGFGFIEMPKPGEAKAALKSLNGNEVDGNKIRVKRAAPKESAASSPKNPEND
jgi:RNA recognition motif-containing protein